MTPELTTEQKLTAIIEAQVNGGCEKFQHCGGGAIQDWGVVIFIDDGTPSYEAVLMILLDPQGLRAAYGGKRLSERIMMGQTLYNAHFTASHRKPAHRILDAWLSKPEGDPVAAIDTAFKLLP